MARERTPLCPASCPCGSCPVRALLPGPRLGLGLCPSRAAQSSQRVQTLPPAVYPGAQSMRCPRGNESVRGFKGQLQRRSIADTEAPQIDRGHRGPTAVDRRVLGLLSGFSAEGGKARSLCARRSSRRSLNFSRRAAPKPRAAGAPAGFGKRCGPERGGCSFLPLSQTS